MRRLMLFSALLVATLGAGVASAADDGPCVTKTFQTKIGEEACKKGGQTEAKKAWKAWQGSVNEAKPEADLGCKSCHSKLAPDFPLKPDAMDTFHKYGGK